MSNNLLHKEIRKNPIPLIVRNDLLIDELFQIMEARINKDNYIVIKTFTPLNYVNTGEILSHHSETGKYFYNKKGKIIQFMLDAKKCIHINKKHNRLRKALYYKK